jgi:hypothetical protein
MFCVRLNECCLRRGVSLGVRGGVRAGMSASVCAEGVDLPGEYQRITVIAVSHTLVARGRIH